MCCVCKKTSRHPNSVQCEGCMACAHAKCAGYKTFAEAATSNDFFFCGPCGKLRKTGAPRPSPLKTPSLSTRQSVPPSVSAPSIANNDTSSSPSVENSSDKQLDISSPVLFASSPCNNSSLSSPSRSFYSTPFHPDDVVGPSCPINSSASPILGSRQTLPIDAKRHDNPPIPFMPDLSILVSPNGRPQNSSLSQVDENINALSDEIPEIQPHHHDHNYNSIPHLMSLNIQPSVPPASTPPSFHPDLPSLDDVMETHISTLDHIPKACRDTCAAILSSLLNKATNDPSSFNYRLILLFSKVVLFTPLRGGRNSSRNLSSAIADRLRRWSQGQFIPLWTEARDNQVKVQRRARRQNIDPTQDNNARRAEKLARSGQYGRAIQV